MLRFLISLIIAIISGVFSFLLAILIFSIPGVMESIPASGGWTTLSRQISALMITAVVTILGAILGGILAYKNYKQ